MSNESGMYPFQNANQLYNTFSKFIGEFWYLFNFQSVFSFNELAPGKVPAD